MKTTVVPKGQSLKVLLEMEKQIENAWVILDKNVFEELSQSCDQLVKSKNSEGKEEYCMKWEPNTEHSKVRISCDISDKNWGIRLTYMKLTNNRSNFYIPTQPTEIIRLKFE